MDGEQHWALVLYILPTGYCPTFEFLCGLRTTHAKAYIAFREVKKPLLEEFGPVVGMPLWRRLGDGLGEIRWRGPQRGNFRIYASPESDRRIAMFFGADKRWRTFSIGDRRTCLAYRADFRSGDYDQEKREYLAQAYYRRRHQQFP